MVNLQAAGQRLYEYFQISSRVIWFIMAVISFGVQLHYMTEYSSVEAQYGKILWLSHLFALFNYCVLLFRNYSMQ